MMKYLALGAFACLVGNSFAGPAAHPEVKMPKEFDRIAALVGSWEGTAPAMHKEEGKTEEKVSVEYIKTSGGTAIVEKLGPGTPHEMVSIYHVDKGKVAMTHYCMLGNHPTMKLKKATDTTLEFEMTSPMGVTSMKEPHMHALTITMLGPDQMTQEWVSFDKGKKSDTTKFTLTRKTATP